MKIEISVCTGKVGSTCKKVIEVDKSDFDDGEGGVDMESLDECMLDELFNIIQWDYRIVE